MKSSFSTASASRNSQSKKVESKKPFRLCKKARFGLQSKKAVLTDKSDCIRNDLKPRKKKRTHKGTGGLLARLDTTS